jgi:hypothetical protein
MLSLGIDSGEDGGEGVEEESFSLASSAILN